MSRRIAPVVVRRQRGYSLIEVIVAFALLAAGLSLLLGTLSGSAKQVRWAGDSGRAAIHAQSLLDQVGVGEQLKPGQRDGDFDDGRYRWTMKIAPWTDPAMPTNKLSTPGAMHLMELDLAVEWGEGHPGQRLELKTLRLAPPGTEMTL